MVGEERMKMKKKRIPVLERFETHMDHNTKKARNVPVYRMHLVEIDEKGNPVWGDQK